MFLYLDNSAEFPQWIVFIPFAVVTIAIGVMLVSLKIQHAKFFQKLRSQKEKFGFDTIEELVSLLEREGFGKVGENRSNSPALGSDNVTFIHQHKELPMYAISYSLGKPENRIVRFNLVSFLDKDHDLSTYYYYFFMMPDSESFIQVFEDAGTVQDLMARHGEALKFLEEKGLAPVEIPGDKVAKKLEEIGLRRGKKMQENKLNVFLMLFGFVSSDKLYGRYAHSVEEQVKQGVAKL